VVIEQETGDVKLWFTQIAVEPALSSAGGDCADAGGTPNEAAVRSQSKATTILVTEDGRFTG
jgi:hypothetical protein